jgi:hypothetical protein
VTTESYALPTDASPDRHRRGEWHSRRLPVVRQRSRRLRPAQVDHGVIEENGHQRWEPIVRVTLSSPPGADSPRLSYLADEWADRFDEPSEPVVPDDRRDDLRRDYSEIRYVVGVCSPSWDEREDAVGCYNVSTTRENFNAVQVHDRARASSDGTYLTIHSTDGTWSFDSE